MRSGCYLAGGLAAAAGRGQVWSQETLAINSYRSKESQSATSKARHENSLQSQLTPLLGVGRVAQGAGATQGLEARDYTHTPAAALVYVPHRVIYGPVWGVSRLKQAVVRSRVPKLTIRTQENNEGVGGFTRTSPASVTEIDRSSKAEVRHYSRPARQLITGITSARQKRHRRRRQIGSQGLWLQHPENKSHSLITEAPTAILGLLPQVLSDNFTSQQSLDSRWGKGLNTKLDLGLRLSEQPPITKRSPDISTDKSLYAKEDDLGGLFVQSVNLTLPDSGWKAEELIENSTGNANALDTFHISNMYDQPLDHDLDPWTKVKGLQFSSGSGSHAFNSMFLVAVCSTVAVLFGLSTVIVVTLCCCRRQKKTTDGSAENDQEASSVAEDVEQSAGFTLFRSSRKRSSVGENLETRKAVQTTPTTDPEGNDAEMHSSTKRSKFKSKSYTNWFRRDSRQKDDQENGQEHQNLSVKDRIQKLEGSETATAPVSTGSVEAEENRERHKPRKKKPTSKAFEEFESSGVLISFGQVPKNRPGSSRDSTYDPETASGEDRSTPTSDVASVAGPSTGLLPDVPRSAPLKQEDLAAVTRDSEILKSFRRAPPPKNRSKARRPPRQRGQLHSPDFLSGPSSLDSPLETEEETLSSLKTSPSRDLTDFSSTDSGIDNPHSTHSHSLPDFLTEQDAVSGDEENEGIGRNLARSAEDNIPAQGLSPRDNAVPRLNFDDFMGFQHVQTSKNKNTETITISFSQDDTNTSSNTSNQFHATSSANSRPKSFHCDHAFTRYRLTDTSQPFGASNLTYNQVNERTNDNALLARNHTINGTTQNYRPRDLNSNVSTQPMRAQNDLTSSMIGRWNSDQLHSRDRVTNQRRTRQDSHGDEESDSKQPSPGKTEELVRKFQFISNSSISNIYTGGGSTVQRNKQLVSPKAVTAPSDFKPRDYSPQDNPQNTYSAADESFSPSQAQQALVKFNINLKPTQV